MCEHVLCACTHNSCVMCMCNLYVQVCMNIYDVCTCVMHVCVCTCVSVMGKFWCKVHCFLQFSREFRTPRKIRITKICLLWARDQAESFICVVPFYPQSDPRRLDSFIIPTLQWEPEVPELHCLIW